MLRRLGCAVVVLVAGCSSRDRGLGQPEAGPTPSAIAPSIASHAASVEAHVGTRADAPFHLRERASGVGVSVSLVGAAGVPVVAVGASRRFPRAFAGHDVRLEVTPEGVEDFVHFATAPSEPTVSYELRLDPTVAGLRLVSEVLELLDADGVPRLRMAPPWIATVGEVSRHDVSVQVEGCAVDVDPRVPWNRPVVAPGARTCRVRLRWPEGVRYPAVLDPAWTATASTAVGHNHAATVTLADGDVLVSGGCANPTTLTASVEIYSASKKVFTTVAGLPSARANHTATLLADGRVLFVGGDSATGSICASTGSAIKDAPVLDPTTAKWKTTTNVVPRTAHTASRLADGRVLVVGGNKGGPTESSAEIYNPTTDSWKAAGTLPEGRTLAAQVTLTGGDVLVAGGYTSASTITDAVARYVASSGTWTTAGKLASPAAYLSMVAMPDGSAWVAGGRADASTSPAYPAAVQRFVSATNTWVTVGNLSLARQSLGALLLPSGNVLYVGGSVMVGGSYSTYATADLFAPDGTRQAWPSLALTRAAFGMALVGPARDRVLVVGGVTVGAVPRSAEVTALGGGVGGTCTTSSDCDLSLSCVGGKCVPTADAGVDASLDAADAAGDAVDAGAPKGTACTTGATCASGSCVDGVCCDATCDSPCLACVAAKTIVGVDGACAPVKAGVADPRGACVATAASTCGQDGRCDGAGGCSYHPAGTTCPGGACDGAGACAAADAGADAADAFTPVDPGKTPVVPAGLATVCKTDGECASGHCVEGVCCDKPCTGSCESCVLPSSPGRCALVPLGVDPKRACSAVPCTRTCDGGGACISAFPGVQCSASRCTSANAGVGPTVCPAVGAACPAAVPFDCGAYACHPAFGACLRDCRASDDCAPGNVCDVGAGRCVPAVASDGDGGCAVPSTAPRTGAGLSLLAALSVVGALRRGLRRRG